MEKLRKFWVKSKWYILAGLMVLVLVVGLLLGSKDKTLSSKFVKKLFDSQKKIVEKEIERKKKASEPLEDNINEAEKRVKKIDQKLEDDKAEIDNMDLKELADAWDEIGL